MKLGPVAGRYELASIGKPVGEESAEVHRTIPLPIGAAFRALHDLYLDDFAYRGLLHVGAAQWSIRWGS
jgi:hypothetical protein